MIIAAAVMLAACTKSEIRPACLSVTQKFLATGDTVIHWHKVCNQELEKWQQFPKLSQICDTDPRVIETIVEPDKCKTK